jgi:hypothetical protein
LIYLLVSLRPAEARGNENCSRPQQQSHSLHPSASGYSCLFAIFPYAASIRELFYALAMAGIRLFLAILGVLARAEGVAYTGSAVTSGE